MNNIYKTDVWINANSRQSIRQSIWFEGDEYDWIPTRYDDYSTFHHYYNCRGFAQHFNPLFF